MKTRLLAIISVIFLISCSSSKRAFDSWLGTWEKVDNEEVYVEKWEKVNDSLFFGNSYFIIKNDTITSEEIQLKTQENGIFYVVVVNVHGKGISPPFKFKLVETKGSSWKFENKTHDFPQVITYKLNGKNTLDARISGTEKGEFREEQFLMKRVE